jgi:protein TonB
MIVALMSALLIAQADAVPEPGVRPQYVRPDWSRWPTGDEFARVYPREARQHDVSGRAVVSCKVTEKGRLTDCEVLEETPANAGFGEAALELTPLFQMRRLSRDGQPVGGATVRVPIVFRSHE